MEPYREPGHDKETAKKVLEYANTCQQFSPGNIDYRFFTDSVKELSGAALVGLNLVSEDDPSKTIVRAVSGAPEVMSRLMDFLGYSVEGTESEAKYDEIRIDERNKLIYFASFKDIGYYDSLPRLAPVIKIVEKLLLPGGLYAMEFDHDGEFLGIITLIMPKGKAIENIELVELYISQIAATIKRVRAEKKLQQRGVALEASEAKFRAYLESSPLGIFVVNNQGQYIGVNQAACQMSGYTEEELLELSIPDFLDPKFLGKGMETVERLQSQGYVQEDLMVRKKNGEAFWINLAAAKVDHNRMIAFCQDITDRKDKEQRAKELNCLHDFSRLLHTEKDDLARIFQETVLLLPLAFQYPENAGARITFRQREFITHDYESPPWALTVPFYSSGKQAGTIEVGYHRLPLHDDTPFLPEERLMLETIAVHLGRVADQFQAKEDLQNSSNRLSVTLHSIGDGVIATDTVGRITRLNPQAEKLTGWAEKEALGRAVHEVFTIVDAGTGEPVSNPLYRVIETGKTQNLENDTILIARDGTEHHISDSAAPVRDNDGKMFGVIMVFSDVTERRKAEETLKYQFSFETMLAEISSHLASQPSEQLEQSINHALQQIGEFFQVDRSYVFQFSGGGTRMSNTYEWCGAGIESMMDRLQDIAIDSFPWWAERVRKNMHINIPEVDNLPPDAEAEKKEFRYQGTRSLLTIPLTRNGIVSGFLGLDAVKSAKTWTENHVMLLKVVAELISAAHARRLTEEEVRHHSFHDGLTGLYNRVYLGKEMERLDTERQLPIGIIMADLNGLKLANDTFGHEAGDQMLKQTAEVLKSACRSEDIIARWGGDEFVIFLPQTTEQDANNICQRIEEKCRTTFVEDIPLSLALGTAIKHRTDQGLAETLKEAEENMYRNKLADSQLVKNDVLDVMLKNLEARSYETAGHYAVMQHVAHQIGKQMNLSESDLSKLRVLITLHDIGEIAVPEEILTRKGPLTEEEWSLIKKHPETGYRIVRAVEGFAQVAEGILSHHERWDGSGYPQGLKSNEIPLLARITAIADAYEVMTAGRPYRPAMSELEVIAELKRCAGSHFDPDLVGVLLRLLARKT